jgi:peptidoglycan/LPS O-acetylase OafA/YrhL
VVFAVLCLVFASRKFVTIAAVVIAVSAALVVFLASPTYLFTHFDYGIFRCFYGFFVGHLTYRIFLCSRLELSGLKGNAIEIAALVLAGIYLTFTHSVPTNIWTMAAPLVFAVVVWTFAFEAGKVSAFLRRKVFLVLGLLSYSIYMVHDFIAYTTIKFVNGCSAVGESEVSTLYRSTCRAIIPPEVFGNPWVLDLVSLAFLALVIGLSTLTYRYIEVPGRKTFNALAKRWDRRAETVSPAVQQPGI